MLLVLDNHDSFTFNLVQYLGELASDYPLAADLRVERNDALNLEQIRSTLADYRRRIDSGSATFEDLARQYSEDGSATGGGDLGWATPGMMVPEFEEAMNALPAGGLSQPVNSRFGVHLVQVLERRQVEVDPKQVRDQARSSLREQKFDEAYAEWVRDVKSRAYIEMREPPL
mgnify:CR=1 FL=1